MFNPRAICQSLIFVVLTLAIEAHAAPPDQTVISVWQMQEASKVHDTGATLSTRAYSPAHWYTATVPGTVLTTLVDNHVYPEPLYGENNRPEVIPDSLSRTPFWYRAAIAIPRSYTGRNIALNFDGINYSADIWVNGKQLGTIRGAFQRGVFDITSLAKPGTEATIAVLITPQPHPGTPHEHTLRAGMGQNGGDTATDGPTFLSTIGWDWIPAIRDRDTGIWRSVYLTSSGPVVIKDPVVTSDLSASLKRADITIKTTLENLTDHPQTAQLTSTIGNVHLHRTITLEPHQTTSITLSPATDTALRILNPKLWWPNGYGAQNLYHLHLEAIVEGHSSQVQDLTFGIRKITYTIPTSTSLSFVVNGVPIFIRGGDWGLDEAMKRIPIERLEAQIKMHQLANLNMIRNWVGQSTSDEFFALCDKYGILVWDEFFQPNPSDGPNPDDLKTYLANVHDKILRFRNHPSIALWCARNEGNPPAEINTALKQLLAELDPTRLYQPNSSDGFGVRSHGPYSWRVPRELYWIEEGFKSETGTMSIPTLESIQGMMPEKDWSSINDDWAEHDFAAGASRANLYPAIITKRYGSIKNLADFVRKSQLMNFEDYRAMYEGRNAEMFHPTTGILTWMSHPAQPSFVWQLYHYDLEPNSSLFAVKSASEPIHIQFNEILDKVQVINNLPQRLTSATAQIDIYNLDGTRAGGQTFKVNAPGSAVTDAGQVEYHEPLSRVHFLHLQLLDATGKLLSDSFYWHNLAESADSFSDLERMPKVVLNATITRADNEGETHLTVNLTNPTTQIALMAHLQLHRGPTGPRVLPVFYSDNYVSLIGGASRTITITVPTKSLAGEEATVLIDGWNIGIVPTTIPTASIALNENSQVEHWPQTGLPIQTQNLR